MKSKDTCKQYTECDDCGTRDGITIVSCPCMKKEGLNNCAVCLCKKCLQARTLYSKTL